MKNKLSFLILSAVVFLMSFAGAAWGGAAVVGGDASIVDLAKPVLEAVLAGQPGLAAALALVFVAAALRRYGGRRVAFLNTDAGGALLVLVGSFGGAVASVLYTGGTWSLGLAWTAFQVAAGAAGGYSLVKRLLVDPFLRPYVIAKMPQWLRIPVELMLAWVFSKPDPVAEAVAAGNAAVKRAPSAGISGVVGKPTEVE